MLGIKADACVSMVKGWERIWSSTGSVLSDCLVPHLDPLIPHMKGLHMLRHHELERQIQAQKG